MDASYLRICFFFGYLSREEVIANILNIHFAYIFLFLILFIGGGVRSFPIQKILQILAKGNIFCKSTIYFFQKWGWGGAYGKFSKTKKTRMLRLVASLTYLFVNIYLFPWIDLWTYLSTVQLFFRSTYYGHWVNRFHCIRSLKWLSVKYIDKNKNKRNMELGKVH